MDNRTKRILTHRHNGFFGSAAMMKSQAQAILNSQTATEETRIIARQILDLTLRLSKSLKTRRPFPEES